MLNKFIGHGRLARDPVVTISQDGRKIARFTLCVDRDNKKGTDYISCISFNKLADFTEQYLKKGTESLVEGTVATGNYTKNGVKHYTTDIWVSKIDFCGTKKSNEEASKASEPFDYANNVPDGNGYDEEVPFS